MRRINQLTELNTKLDQLSLKMRELKVDLDQATDCIKGNNLITIDVYKRVVSGLLEIIDINDKCKSEYIKLMPGTSMSENIDELKESIDEKVAEIKLNAKLLKYKAFLNLKAKDEETEKLLSKPKSKLEKILDSYSEEKDKELEPYLKFVNMVKETESKKIVELLFEIRNEFEYELLGKAAIEKQITFVENVNPDDEDILEIEAENWENREVKENSEVKENREVNTNHEVKENSGAKENSEVKENREVNANQEVEENSGAKENREVEENKDAKDNSEVKENKAEKDEKNVKEDKGENASLEDSAKGNAISEKENVKGIDEKQGGIADVVTEGETDGASDKAKEEATEKANEADSEKEEIIKRNLTLKPEIKEKGFYVDKNDTDNKKVGTKVFFKDMRTRFLKYNALVLKAIANLPVMNIELITKMYGNKLSFSDVSNSIEYFEEKGYVRKYGVKELGSFYVCSPRLLKVLESKEVRSLFKIAVNKDSKVSTVSDSQSAVLNRLAGIKILNDFMECLDVTKAVSEGELYDETFTEKITICEENVMFIGAFFDKFEKTKVFFDFTREKANSLLENAIVIIAGINAEEARKLADYFVEKFELGNKKIYYYSLIEKNYYDYKNNDKIKIQKIYEKIAEKIEAGKEEAESKEVAGEETAESKEVESEKESESKEVVSKETAESKEVESEEETESKEVVSEEAESNEVAGEETAESKEVAGEEIAESNEVAGEEAESKEVVSGEAESNEAVSEEEAESNEVASEEAESNEVASKEKAESNVEVDSLNMTGKAEAAPDANEGNSPSTENERAIENEKDNKEVDTQNKKDDIEDSQDEKEEVELKIREKLEMESENLKLDLNVEEVLNNVYRMLAEEKFYCAITYLSSLKSYNEEIKVCYDKLAYAINAPCKRCSYSSQRIFALYPADEDIYNKYLMVSASIRNFFMDHISYDYDMKSLHSNVAEFPIVRDNNGLTKLMYTLFSFKENINKGIDVYADYRAKDQLLLERKAHALRDEATVYYDNYVNNTPKNHKKVIRYVNTWKLVYDKEGEFAFFLKEIMDGDNAGVELASEFVKSKFMNEGCSLDYQNIDEQKINNYVTAYWKKAGASGKIQFKSSDLMSGLRNNLINSMEKVIKLICEWINLNYSSTKLSNDEGTKRYNSIKKDLLENADMAVSYIENKMTSLSLKEFAGATVLKNTISELIDRISGKYDENSYKYYYIDFLKGNEVLLGDDYLPDMCVKFADFEELSLSSRILRHSRNALISFEERLDNIFCNYGDDYGTAKLIMDYLSDIGRPVDEEKYNIIKSQEQAEEDAKIQLDDFIENLELAQSYGQIEETRENKKEKIQKMANEWFIYAKESKNYGFFKLILENYRKKIREDAKVRGNALLEELKKVEGDVVKNGHKKDRIDKIREMINIQNYTVAEDLLSRINSVEEDDEFEMAGVDYLQKFIDDYSYNYQMVANSSKKLSVLVNTKIHNKDTKVGSKLIENWLSNGSLLGERRLVLLLDALGFTGVAVEERPKIGKVENYYIRIKKSKEGKINYKHPIPVFGSKAMEDGFRLVCLYGKYDAARLIEEFKNIGESQNTLVLLDDALQLSERRILAKKTKSDLNDNVFAVIDRVMIAFLADNYNVQFINQILMRVMMPFAYCQPYVWDSSKVMPPEIFMGRKEELEKIESSAGVNIVYGGRQLGKSALFKMAKMNIDNNENNDRAVLVDIKGLDYEQAANRVGHEMYDTKVIDQDVDTTDWWELARIIKNRLNDEEKPRIPYLLLLMDEADDFIESCKKVDFQPFDALKSIQSIGSGRFKFVIAGLHNIVRFHRDAALSGNSVIPHLTALTIKPFKTIEARKLIEEPLHYLGFRFSEDKKSLVSLILANTNYFPGLIQLYCANLIEAMRKNDYAGYNQVDTPAYEVNPEHIKKVLSDPYFMEQIREMFEITLKLDEDNMYYIIALLMAYLYHQNVNSAAVIDGFSADNIIEAAKEYGVKKVAIQSKIVIEGFMQELTELNVFRITVDNMYLFSRYSFFQMMGTSNEVEEKLVGYMED